MRIVIVISSLATGGAERATVELSRQWTLRGHAVTIVMIGRMDGLHHVVADGVAVVALDLAGDSPSPLIALLANFRRAAAIRREALRLRPDVIIGMMDRTAVLVALGCLGLDGLKIGCERTASGVAPLPRSWRALRSLAYGCLDLVIAQTAPVADWILQHTTARRTCVIPNCVAWPLSGTEPAVDPSPFCSPGRRIALAVGRLSSEKRFDLLIEAFSRVAVEHADWDLAIVGEGPERDRLEASIEQFGLGGRVHLPGRVGNAAAWYERASMFVLTSEFEGFPNVLLEAMAHGVAPVSVDCPFGPRDILRPGVDGLLVETGDPSAVARGMTALMDDEALRRRIARAALEVRRRFSSDRTMRLWDAALGLAGTGSPDER